MNEQISSIQRLETLGFKKVGVWQLHADRIFSRLDDHAEVRNILYAFICEGKVAYIGKSARSLKSRLNGYQHPGISQFTNIEGNKRIREALMANKPVDIYALFDNGLLHYGGFYINLAAGLEDSLISAFKPAWNKLGV